MEEKPTTPGASAASTPATDPNVLVFPKSANVLGARFDPAAETVDVTFKNQSVHRFGKFSAGLLGEWRDAKSAGTWFHEQIKTRPEVHPHLGTVDEKGVLHPPRAGAAAPIAPSSTPAAKQVEVKPEDSKPPAPPKAAPTSSPAPTAPAKTQEASRGVGTASESEKPRPGTRAFIADLMAKKRKPTTPA